MNEFLYDLLGAALLGIGSLCMFLGYDTSATLVESVLHSVHERAPDAIDSHAGYNGTAVCMVLLMVMSLMCPWTLGLLGSKGSTLLGSVMFTLHLSSFFYIHYLPFYVSCAGIGIGYALFYSGNSAYVTEHSTQQTIGRNSAMSYALTTSSLMGGGLVILLTSTSSPDMKDLSNLTVAATEARAREYSDSNIRVMYTAFASAAFLSNIIFAFLPTRGVKNSLAKVNDRKNRIGLAVQLKAVFSTMSEKNLLLAAPFYLFFGLMTAFWMSIFPTTLSYSRKLAEHEHLQAYYLISLGIGEILMGALISVACKYIRNFALLPTMIIGAIFYLTTMILALLSTPIVATHTPTSDSSLFLDPSPQIALIIGLLLGATDSALATARTVLCAQLIRTKIAHVFSISRFLQSIAMGTQLFLSSFISMPMHFAINLVFGVAAVVSFRRAVRNSSSDDEVKEAIKEDNIA